MRKIKYFKRCILLILILDFVLYFVINSISYIVLILIPIAYLFIIYILRKRYERKLSHLDLCAIDQLSGLDFEYYLYFLFKRHHLKTKITPYTHDFGADLIVRYHRKRIVIQAKRWNETVGIKAVQEAIGAMSYYKAKYGVVITNNFYTKSAVELANKSEIILINRYDLAKMEQMDTPLLISLLLKKRTNKNPIQDFKLDHCPYCGNKLVKRNGRYGNFLGCSNYPNCTYTKDI